MARLPRLSLAGQPHWLIQRGHSGAPVVADNADRLSFLAALKEAAVAEQVQIHAFALLDNEVHLLATPAFAAGLSRMMQALGRRYVSAYRRRHGGSGTLWAGRFRCAVVEPGATLLEVLCLIDGLAGAVPGPVDTSLAHGAVPEPVNTSLAHRAGGETHPLLVDPPSYWLLGNTPFERQAAWRRRVADGLPALRAAALRTAALGGWAVGSPAFAAAVASETARPAAPRLRGRPRLKKS